MRPEVIQSSRDTGPRDGNPVALLLIDVINDLDFDEGDELLKHALPAAQQIAALKTRAKRAGVPTIYVNDNFGRWRSNFSAMVDHCLREGCRGRPLALLLRPDPDDYFVLKPRHSAFFSTALDVLLEHLGVHTVILTGFAGNICVLFTAHDAHMRELGIVVPRDCIASNTESENIWALRQVERVIGADTRAAAELDFAELAKRT
jgi:nicotinamidase-related amidase